MEIPGMTGDDILSKHGYAFFTFDPERPNQKMNASEATSTQ